MDLISLYYFSELAKDLHMTRTASRLFISQQTLSNHIKRLEEDLGCELLERKPRLRLTMAGEATLYFAGLVTDGYTNLKDAIADITENECGILRIGGSNLRLNACLPKILPQFSSVYPNVEFRLTEANSVDLEPMIISGDIDFAMVMPMDEDPILETQHLLDEPTYLCVAESILKRYYGERSEEIKRNAMNGATVDQFSELPFCLNSSRLGKIVMKCFEDAAIVPKIYAMSSGTHISLSLCIQRSAACITSQMRLETHKDNLPPDINIFPFYSEGRPVTQPVRLIYRKDRYISRYARLFLDLLRQYFVNIGELHLEHMAE
jgi:DNA-binding transcriptional LysR family regulator